VPARVPGNLALRSKQTELDKLLTSASIRASEQRGRTPRPSVPVRPYRAGGSAAGCRLTSNAQGSQRCSACQPYSLATLEPASTICLSHSSLEANADGKMQDRERGARALESSSRRSNKPRQSWASASSPLARPMIAHVLREVSSPQRLPPATAQRSTLERRAGGRAQPYSRGRGDFQKCQSPRATIGQQSPRAIGQQIAKKRPPGREAASGRGGAPTPVGRSRGGLSSIARAGIVD
jgi:hypothetical protein